MIHRDHTGSEFLDEAFPLFTEQMMDRLRAQFEAFHRSNPHVYDRLVELAKAERAAGVTRGSINRLFEVARHEAALRTRGDTFKLNNNYRALYARKLMDEHDHLAGWFEVRERTSA